MKKNIQLMLVTAMGSLLVTGCVYSHREAVRTQPAMYPTPTGRVVVYETPPAPLHEVIRSPRDQDNQTWIAGYWSYTDSHWVWVPGHLESRPTSGSVWIPGQWDHNPDGRGWEWMPGHWE